MAAKGDSLVKEADKRLQSFSLPWNKGAKMEEAADIYKQAAGQFKLSQQWDLAGETYIKAAELYEKTSNEHEACNMYTDAAKAFKNSSPKDAIKTFKIACQVHLDHNRFSTAGKLFKEVAQLEEKELNTKGALKAYADAANCFKSEDSSASMNQMLLKVAELSAVELDYTRAIEVYEGVARSAMDNRLQSYSVKDYLFKAGLCHFTRAVKAGGDDAIKDVETAMDNYKDMSPAFEPSRECKLLENCLTAFKNNDVEAFTDHIFKYDSISPLDTWTASLLLEIKNILKNGGSAFKSGNAEAGGELDLS